MKHLRILVLLLFVSFNICSLVNPCLSLQVSRRISSYGSITTSVVTPSLKVFRHQGINELEEDYLGTQETAEVIAEYLDMARGWPYHGDDVVAAHQINPEVKCLYYRNIRSIKSYRIQEYDLALANGWLLRDSSGKLVKSSVWSTCCLVDFCNPDYQQWVADLIKADLDLYGFDGVFTDNGFTCVYGTWWDVTGQPVNPRTGTYFTAAEVQAGLIALHQTIKNTIGSKLDVANGIFEGKRFWNDQDMWTNLISNSNVDGYMSEGIFNWGFSEAGQSGHYYTEDVWKQSVDFVIWTQNNFLNDPTKVFLPHARCAQEQIPADCNPEKMATFAFASLLLGIEKSQNYLSLQHAILSDEVQNLFKVDLGTPIGAYYLVDGTHVYARDFTKIRVLVNPTDQPYSVNLNGNYETLESQVVSSVTIGSHTAIILKAM